MNRIYAIFFWMTASSALFAQSNDVELVKKQLQELQQTMQRMETQHKEVLYHLSRLDPELARRLGMDMRQVSKELLEEEAGDGDTGGNS